MNVLERRRDPGPGRSGEGTAQGQHQQQGHQQPTGTVLAIASLGLLINEKAGIVNLGAEGMMLVAAVAAIRGKS